MAIAPKHGGENPDHGVSDHQGDHFIMVPFDQGPYGDLGAGPGFFEGFSEGGSDGREVFAPEAVVAGETAAQLLVSEPLPKAEIEIAEEVHAARRDTASPRELRSGVLKSRARAMVNGFQWQKTGAAREEFDIPSSAFGEGQIEHPLEAVLLIILGGTGAYEHKVGHLAVGSTAVGTGMSPPWRPWRAV
jgi:hypothetical protein